MLDRIHHALHLFAYSLRAIGPGRMLRGSLRWSADPEARAVDSGFDTRYGTDTNADLTPAEALIPRDRRGEATMYLPTMDADLAAMVDALGWSDARLAQATFVDLGSGKARAVLLAAMRRFREVVGVELSPVLHEVAARNLAILTAARALGSPVRLVQGDAAAFDVPRGPLVLYLYHPFREPIAELVMARVIASLEADPRPAAILYGHPTLQRPLDPDVFARGGVFRREVDDARETRRFRIGRSVWTNAAWLEAPAPAVAVAR